MTRVRRRPAHDAVFHAVNWLLCGQNTRSDKSLTMWPKRYVSTIDFFPQTDGHAIPGHISAQLPDGQIIHIGDSSEVSAESLHGIVVTDYFTNTYAGDKRSALISVWITSRRGMFARRAGSNG